MLIGRFILALALCLSVIATAAPATPVLGPSTAADQAADQSRCCHSGTKSDSHDSKQPCHNSSCVMQCCRLLPVQADARPILTQTFELVFADPLPLVTLHSLTHPEAIFHPPKA